MAKVYLPGIGMVDASTMPKPKPKKVYLPGIGMVDASTMPKPKPPPAAPPPRRTGGGGSGGRPRGTGRPTAPPVAPVPERLFPFQSRLVPLGTDPPSPTGGRGSRANRQDFLASRTEPTFLSGLLGNLFGGEETAAPSGQVNQPGVALGTQRVFGGQTYEAVAFTDTGKPMYRQLGSPGPPSFQDTMTNLAIDMLGNDEETAQSAETRFKERLGFVNLGFGGSQATHDSAVINLIVQLNQGNYPDIISDQTMRDLPWEEMGFSSYQEYLEWLGYEDLGNGTWRLLSIADREDLGLGAASGRGFASSGGGGGGGQGFSSVPGRSFFGLTNWRI